MRQHPPTGKSFRSSSRAVDLHCAVLRLETLLLLLLLLPRRSCARLWPLVLARVSALIVGPACARVLARVLARLVPGFWPGHFAWVLARLVLVHCLVNYLVGSHAKFVVDYLVSFLVGSLGDYLVGYLASSFVSRSVCVCCVVSSRVLFK